MNDDIKLELIKNINFNTTALVLFGYLVFVVLTPAKFDYNLFVFLVGVTFCVELTAELFKLIFTFKLLKGGKRGW